MRDDHIYRETRWLAAFIVPFLVAAFYILYLRTGETKELFPWEIKAPMSAMMLASAYIGGAYFFARAVFEIRWHHIAVGFLPVATFAALMGIATILHWNIFNHLHFTFYIWVALYFTTPFLVLGTWLRNRRTDPGTPEPDDFVFPPIARYIIGGIGLANLIVSIALFIQPALMINIWPWALTPLTARIVGALYALEGVFGIYLAADARWSAAKLTVETEFVSAVFILIAIVRTWYTFNPANPASWIFAINISAVVLVIPIFYLYLEGRRRRATRIAKPLA